jgi:hypothetical protein
MQSTVISTSIISYITQVCDVKSIVSRLITLHHLTDLSVEILPTHHASKHATTQTDVRFLLFNNHMNVQSAVRSGAGSVLRRSGGQIALRSALCVCIFIVVIMCMRISHCGNGLAHSELGTQVDCESVIPSLHEVLLTMRIIAFCSSAYVTFHVLAEVFAAAREGRYVNLIVFAAFTLSLPVLLETTLNFSVSVANIMGAMSRNPSTYQSDDNPPDSDAHMIFVVVLSGFCMVLAAVWTWTTGLTAVKQAPHDHGGQVQAAGPLTAYQVIPGLILFHLVHLLSVAPWPMSFVLSVCITSSVVMLLIGARVQETRMFVRLPAPMGANLLGFMRRLRLLPTVRTPQRNQNM